MAGVVILIFKEKIKGKVGKLLHKKNLFLEDFQRVNGVCFSTSEESSFVLPDREKTQEFNQVSPTKKGGHRVHGDNGELTVFTL